MCTCSATVKQKLIRKIYCKRSLKARVQTQRETPCQMRGLPAAARRSRWAGIANEILMFFRSGKKSAQDISINEPIETDKSGNTLTLMDTMAVDDTIIDNIDTKMKSEKLYDFIDKVLTRREKDIIRMRYGLGGGRPLPQRVVAKKLGISRSYVSRIEKKALQKLRGEFEGE